MMRKQLEQNSKGNKKGWSKSIKRGQMANRRRDGVEGRKSIYTKEQGVKSRNNPVTP